MKDAEAIDHVEKLLQYGLKNFRNALKKYTPYGLEKNGKYNKYIPERCLTTYFAHSLIKHKFCVFNEQDYCRHGKGDCGKLDLLAINFRSGIQIFVEAKGNLEGRYNEVSADIDRMQNFCLKNLPRCDTALKHINIVITTNWWYKQLSEWWTNEDEYPKTVRNNGQRTGAGWPVLKKQLLKSKRDLVSLNKYNEENLDALYAIFTRKSIV